MNKIKVENHPNLYRDPCTNLIVNTDSSSYDSYLNMRKTKDNERKRIEKIENEMNSIKDDLNEIKTLLRKIAQ